MDRQKPDRLSRESFNSRLRGFLHGIISVPERRQRRALVLATIGLLLGIGLIDFWVGYEISMLVFYFLPVALAVVGIGWRFGVVVAVSSVTTWMVGDVAAGAHYTTPLVPCWNALIALVTYLVLVWLLSSVVSQQREMEARIRQRTAALTDEIAERERLEKVILEIGEKERSSIGRDLHDDLGQHLTGTALAGQVLGEKLQARKAEEEGDVWRIVRLIEEGIEKTRRLARGLLLAEIERNGLRAALQEFAGTTAEQFRVGCSFQCEEGVDCLEIGTATHLFRITQEAVRNAVRHGNATRIAIVLDLVDGCLVLAVQDNGKGLPPPDRRGQGLGLRIMAHRAAMIHAHFKVEAMTAGGTVVQCRLPVDATQSNAQG